MTSKVVTGVGLGLTLVGAILLFFFAVPRKKWPGYILWGDILARVDDIPSDEREEGIQAKALSFQRWSAIANTVGFGLVALGTLFQIVALLLR